MSPSAASLPKMLLTAWFAAGCALLLHLQLTKRFEEFVAVRPTPTRQANSAPVAVQSFAERLPVAQNAEAVIAGIHQAVSTTHVGLMTIRSVVQNGTTQALGHSELQVTLQGSYANLKQAVGDVLDRFPSVVLKHVNIHRMTGPTDLEAVVDFQLLTRPQDADLATPKP